MTCDNERCEGGWVTVREQYVIDHTPPWPAAETWATWSEEAQIEFTRRHEAIVESIRSTVYPCRECRPDSFFRWVQGHMKADHNTAACEVCTPPRRGSSPAPAPVGPIPDRADLR